MKKMLSFLLVLFILVTTYAPSLITAIAQSDFLAYVSTSEEGTETADYANIELLENSIDVFKYNPSNVQKGHAFQRIYKYEAEAKGSILAAHNKNLEASVWKDCFENWTDYIRSTFTGTDLYKEKVSKYRRAVMIEVLKEAALNDSLAHDVASVVIGVAEDYYSWFDGLSTGSKQAKELLERTAQTIGQSDTISLDQNQLYSIAKTICNELDTLEDVFEIGNEATELFDIYVTYVMICNFDLAAIDRMIECYEKYGNGATEAIATLREIRKDKEKNITNYLLTYYAPEKIRKTFESFAIDVMKTASIASLALAIMDVTHSVMDIAGVPDISDLEKAVFASEISNASISSLSGIVGRCGAAYQSGKFLSDEQYKALISDYLFMFDIARVTTSNTLKWVGKISDEISAKKIATQQDYCKKITGEIALNKLNDAYHKEYSGEKFSYKCTVTKHNDSVVRSDPYKKNLNGEDTIINTVANNTQLTIVEKYENAYFNVWYKLSDGSWIYSENVTLGKAIVEIERNEKAQVEAVLWAKDLIGQAIDYDGVFNVQCVDLIYKYYDYLGQKHSGQNARDFITCSLPAGWERIDYTEGFIPSRGDIAVFKPNHECAKFKTDWAGHVGIVTYGGESGFNAVHQGPSIGPCTEGWFSLDCLACVIRPNFSQTSNPFGKIWVDEITTTNAVIHADIRNDSYDDFGFYIGTSPDNLTKHSEKELGSIVPCLQIFYSVRKWHGALSPNTTYYYMFYAVNGGETYYTGVYNFTTERQNTEYTPFTNLWSDKVTDVDAVIHASVEYSAYDEFGFYIGLNPRALEKFEETASFKIESIWYTVSDWCGSLTPGTEYFYQIYVVKLGQEYRSELKSFTTSGAHSHVPGKTWSVVIAASCIQSGKIAQICQTCGEQINITDTEVSNEHSYDYICDTECNVCGKIRTVEHTFDIVTIAPSCEYEGFTSYTCKICNYSKVDDYRSAVGHSFGDWFATKAPTCIEKGEEKRECSACDHFEIREVGNVDHAYVPTITPPTCSEQGYTTYTCYCGNSYVADYTDAAGHQWMEWYDVAPGKEERSCSACGETESRDKIPNFDVDGNGMVDQADVELLMSILVGNTETETLYDFDFDGALTIYDCVLLMQHIG